MEYNRLAVAPACRAAFTAALVQAIEDSRISWDSRVSRLRSGRDRARDSRRFPVSDLAPYLPSGGTRPDADGRRVNGFKKETIAKIRKNRRRFEERFGPLDPIWAETVDEGLAIFREMIPLHQRRWQRVGKPGAFASARFTGFHEELIQRLLPKGQIVLFRVTAGEQMVGIFYGFAEGNVVYHYQWGLAEFEQNSLSRDSSSARSVWRKRSRAGSTSSIGSKEIPVTSGSFDDAPRTSLGRAALRSAHGRDQHAAEGPILAAEAGWTVRRSDRARRRRRPSLNSLPQPKMPFGNP